jgi:hypothetical protein
VVTPEGLPLAYEVFAGNRADVTTVEEIVDLMEAKYGAAERIWAMDRGMVSEENLDYLRAKRALYIVGTPKGRLKRFEQELLARGDWQQVEPGVEVKLLAHPDGEGDERYVLCRSRARQQKEAAMLRGQQARLRTKLAQIDAALRKKPARQPEKIERRIGKWLGRNTAAEKLFDVEVLIEEDCAVGLRILEDPGKVDWAQAAHGAYLLRTNCTEEDPRKLWRWYIQLTEVEDALTHAPPHGAFALRAARSSQSVSRLPSALGSARAKATPACAPSFITKKSACRRTSWFVFWRWPCGAAWNSGCGPEASATPRVRSCSNSAPSTPWTWCSRSETVGKPVCARSANPNRSPLIGSPGSASNCRPAQKSCKM